MEYKRLNAKDKRKNEIQKIREWNIKDERQSTG